VAFIGKVWYFLCYVRVGRNVAPEFLAHEKLKVQLENGMGIFFFLNVFLYPYYYRVASLVLQALKICLVK